jgi:hypothetical protein
MKSSCHSLIPFLPFLLNHITLPSPELGPILDNSNFTAHSTTEHFFVTTSHAENTASIVKEACLLIRCLAMDILLLRAFASARMCLPSPCLAIGRHATILLIKFP